MSMVLKAAAIATATGDATQLQLAMDMQRDEVNQFRISNMMQGMAYAHATQARNVLQLNAVHNDMRAGTFCVMPIIFSQA